MGNAHCGKAELDIQFGIGKDKTMKSRTVLYADEGMVLTNGKDYGRVIYLAEGADASAYREISEEEYAAFQGVSEI